MTAQELNDMARRILPEAVMADGGSGPALVHSLCDAWVILVPLPGKHAYARVLIPYPLLGIDDGAHVEPLLRAAAEMRK